MNTSSRTHPAGSFVLINVNQMSLQDPFRSILHNQLKPIAWLLSLFYFILAISNWVVLHESLSSIMVIKAMATAIVFLALGGILSRWKIPERWTYTIANGIMAVVLLNGFFYLAYSQEPRSTVHLSLFIIAIGCFYFDKRVFYFALLVSLLGWFLIAYRAGWNDEWGYFGFMQVCASIVAAAVFYLRVHTITDFVSAVQQLQNTQQTLVERTRMLQDATLQLQDQIHETLLKDEELALTNTLYKAVLDSASRVSIIATDPQGTITVFNSGAEKMLGYAAEEMIGKQSPAILHLESEVEEHSQYLSAKYGRPIQGFDVFVEEARLGRYEEREWTYIHKKGNQITVNLAVTAVRNHEGEPIGYLGIATDITERKQAEAALREGEERLRTILDNVVDGIITIDEYGIIESFNNGATRIFGYPAQEIIGKSVNELMPEEHAVKHDGYISRYVETRKARVIGTGREVMGRRKDGSLFPMELGVNHIQLGERHIFTGIVRDITERKQAEELMCTAKEAAESANRTKSDFLARMSHELRTPLNSIIGFSNILLKNKKQNLLEQDFTYLNRILQNGKHLLDLINDILDLSKVEAGRMQVEIGRMSLTQLVQETISQLEGQVRGKNIELRVEMPEPEMFIQSDPSKLKQILINLLGNAIKFTSEGHVTLKVEADPATQAPLALSVIDTGIGIPRDKIDTIFEAFRQAESSTTAKYGGTGLGLAISRSLCQLLGYKISVHSVPGKGSAFRIDLGSQATTLSHTEPVQQAVYEKASLPPVAQDVACDLTNLRGQLVLVIDDEADSRILLSHQLEEFGCRVVTASSGREGLQKASELKPNLITLDLMMPEINGWMVFSELKRNPDLKHIPVVVVSIVADEQQGQLPGAVDLIKKPFKREQLLDVLKCSFKKDISKVLVLQDKQGSRETVDRFLAEFQSEITFVESEDEALQYLRQSQPDLVIADETTLRRDSLSFVNEVRQQPECFHLPIVLLADSVEEQWKWSQFQSDTFVITKHSQSLRDSLHRILLQAFGLKPLPLQTQEGAAPPKA